MLDRTAALPLDVAATTLLERVAMQAFSRGCSVQFIRKRREFSGPYTLRLRIRLNGNVCALHHYHRDPGERLPIMRTPGIFAHVLESDQGNGPDYYVVPAVVFDIRFGKEWNYRDLTLCQPFWHPYLDAWHILK